MKIPIFIATLFLISFVIADEEVEEHGRWYKRKAKWLKNICEGDKECQDCVENEMKEGREERRNTSHDPNLTEEEKLAACKTSMGKIAEKCNTKIPEKLEGVCHFWKDRRDRWHKMNEKRLNEICGEEKETCKTCIRKEQEEKKRQWRERTPDPKKSDQEKLEECKKSMDEIATTCEANTEKLQAICDFWMQRKLKWLADVCGTENKECRECVKAEKRAVRVELLKDKDSDKPQEERLAQCKQSMAEVADKCVGDSEKLQDACDHWIHRRHRWGVWRSMKEEHEVSQTSN